MPNRAKLLESTAGCQPHLTGDEKGQAQIFRDRLLQAFGQPDCPAVDGTTAFRHTTAPPYPARFALVRAPHAAFVNEDFVRVSPRTPVAS